MLVQRVKRKRLAIIRKGTWPKFLHYAGYPYTFILKFKCAMHMINFLMSFILENYTKESIITSFSWDMNTLGGTRITLS